MRPNHERRKIERLEHTSAILHSTDPPDFFYRGTMRNFSSAGIYFESNEDLIRGDKVSVSIQSPPAQLAVQAREYFDVQIRWSKALEGNDYQVGYGARIII